MAANMASETVFYRIAECGNITTVEGEYTCGCEVLGYQGQHDDIYIKFFDEGTRPFYFTLKMETIWLDPAGTRKPSINMRVPWLRGPILISASAEVYARGPVPGELVDGPVTVKLDVRKILTEASLKAMLRRISRTEDDLPGRTRGTKIDKAELLRAVHDAV